MIIDNILFAYEILDMLKRKRLGMMGSFTLKLDMSKAYNRVEWGFLKEMMLKLDFERTWVESIMKCISFSLI